MSNSNRRLSSSNKTPPTTSQLINQSSFNSSTIHLNKYGTLKDKQIDEQYQKQFNMVQQNKLPPINNNYSMSSINEVNQQQHNNNNHHHHQKNNNLENSPLHKYSNSSNINSLREQNNNHNYIIGSKTESSDQNHHNNDQLVKSSLNNLPSYNQYNNSQNGLNNIKSYSNLENGKYNGNLSGVPNYLQKRPQNLNINNFQNGVHAGPQSAGYPKSMDHLNDPFSSISLGKNNLSQTPSNLNGGGIPGINSTKSLSNYKYQQQLNQQQQQTLKKNFSQNRVNGLLSQNSISNNTNTNSSNGYMMNNKRNYSEQQTSVSHTYPHLQSQLSFQQSLQNLLPLSEMPKLEQSRSSQKKNGFIKAFAANTHQGLVRNYNEDRVAIILNILKPQNKQYDGEWPNCSFFGIYDGHGGSKCAEFLRDNLHQYVVKDVNFPTNIKLAMKQGFNMAERDYLEKAQKSNPIDKSGSCAITIMIVDDMCYCGNVGDSRAILSSDEGTKIYPLSRDHKPSLEEEQKRIIEAGGKIYQSQIAASNISGNFLPKIQGPLRVQPGRLSVSRTFGDAEAKLPKYGGNPNVVIAEPDIKAFKIQADHDFIILGCDGIYDRLNNKDVIRSIWSVNEVNNYSNLHEFNAKATENLMRESFLKKSLDNITVVMVSFKNLKNKLFPKNKNLNQPNMINKINKPISNRLQMDQVIEYSYIHESDLENGNDSLDQYKMNFKNQYKQQSSSSRLMNQKQNSQQKFKLTNN